MRVARLLLALVAVPHAFAEASTPRDSRTLSALVLAHDVDAIRNLGPSLMSDLVRLYDASDPAGRAAVARVWYRLGWKSAEAQRALTRDVHTSDTDLRLQAQRALGRVSDGPAVVDVPLQNMRRGGNALFRDKAGCALPYDQIHLNPRQRFRLFEGVIAALEDESADVRRIAIRVLQIHGGGQTRGFQPFAAPEARAAAVEVWKIWLADYRSQL